MKNNKQIYRISRKVIRKNNIPMICSICGSTKRINIHHTDENRQNNDISNLIVLCNCCHSKHHYKTRKKCEKCNRFLNMHGTHSCLIGNKKMAIFQKKNIKNRKICKKCGKFLGDNHSCEHPRGMLGKHHTDKAKKQIGLTFRKTWNKKHGKEYRKNLRTLKIIMRNPKFIKDYERKAEFKRLTNKGAESYFNYK